MGHHHLKPPSPTPPRARLHCIVLQQSKHPRPTRGSRRHPPPAESEVHQAPTTPENLQSMTPGAMPSATAALQRSRRPARQICKWPKCGGASISCAPCEAIVEIALPALHHRGHNTGCHQPGSLMASAQAICGAPPAYSRSSAAAGWTAYTVRPLFVLAAAEVFDLAQLPVWMCMS